MKRLFLFVTLLALGCRGPKYTLPAIHPVASSQVPTTPPIASIMAFSASDPDCGKEVSRQPVKIGADPTALPLARTNAKFVTVAHLLEEAVPDVKAREVTGVRLVDTQENTYFVVVANLVEFKLEADGDIHLVLADLKDRSKRICAEIPHEKCASEGPFLCYTMAAREAFVALVRDKYGVPTSTKKPVDPPLQVQVAGLGFYDLHHSGASKHVSTNKFEIHPVLFFENSDCRH